MLGGSHVLLNMHAKHPSRKVKVPHHFNLLFPDLRDPAEHVQLDISLTIDNAIDSTITIT